MGSILVLHISEAERYRRLQSSIAHWCMPLISLIIWWGMLTIMLVFWGTGKVYSIQIV